MACFPLLNQLSGAANSVPGATTNPIPPTNNLQNIPGNRFFDPARTEEIIRREGGFEFVISPLYKRFLAEVIDTVILFIVKILFFVVIMDLFDVNM